MPTKTTTANADRKYSVVIYGIGECPKGTRKHKRQSHDFEHVTTNRTSLDAKISSNSIRDCIRLGSYNETRSRPILVKLNSTREVNTILANRQKLSIGIFIKPDMSKLERETLLLKECRSLITSGKESKEIKIRGKSLYVSNTLYGTVDIVDSTFNQVWSSPSISVIDSSQSNDLPTVPTANQNLFQLLDSPTIPNPAGPQ